MCPVPGGDLGALGGGAEGGDWEAREAPSILIDKGTQFYANESEEREKEVTVFERHRVENEIRHTLSRVMQPTTNGKAEKFFKTVKEKLPETSKRWTNS